MKIRRDVPLEKDKWQIVTIKEAGVKCFIDSGVGTVSHSPDGPSVGRITASGLDSLEV
jgi:hypothetical protein